ncbi:MAG: FAD-dependent oxidoreductase [Candidatus Altiarchaeota archaeon]
MDEIRIAGAGLAGLAAASTLAREGFKVRVLGRKGCSGHDGPPYTCIIKNTPENNVIKELRKFHINLKAYEINPRVIKVSPSFEKNVGFRHYYQLMMGQHKNSLENQLYVECLAESVNFEFNTEAEKANIIATGPPSNQANICGYGHVYAKPPVDKETTYLLYNNDIAPHGYTYISTQDGRTTVMAVVFSRQHFPKIRQLFNHGLETFKPLKEKIGGAKRIGEVSGVGYYLKDPYANLTLENALYVGEAAGIQDAARGFGIRYAIISGALAAKSIIEKVDYYQLMKDYFGDEFQRNYERRHLHDRLSNKDYDKIVALA